MEVKLIEITPEELTMLIEKREQDARAENARELFKEVKRLIAEIEGLGFQVRMPEIGGKYVAKHCPRASSTVIYLSKK
jgi:hypothetical protein